MDADSQILGTDHLDLLVSASSAWGVLTSSAGSALSMHSSQLVTASRTTAGRLLQAANMESVLRQRVISVTDRLAILAKPALYEFREVDHLSPVEVIKAAHAADHLCSLSPNWADGTGSRLLKSIVTAATHRVDGYAAAPYRWTRPRVRSGDAVAVGGAWRPDLPGFTWIDVDEVATHWDTARLLLVTTEVVGEIPVGLPPRSGIFTLESRGPSTETWTHLSVAGPAPLLFWPVCQDWLADQVLDPSPEFVEHRPAV